MNSLSSEAVVQRFREQILQRTPLRIRGGGSKDFYGGPLRGEILDTRALTGIVNYEPSELVITARAGTSLAELKSALAGRRQWLPFEPPEYTTGSTSDGTVGGMVAAGLSGPGRLAAGAVRDFILGVTIMDGEGRVLKFGGEVMKNVAGFDVSRLMAGSLGTLGLLLDVSIKVLPLPVAESALKLAIDQAGALALMNRWAGQPLPITATCWQEDTLWVRLAGARAAVASATITLGHVGATETNESDPDAAGDRWATLRDHTHAFFTGAEPLWRLAVPTTAPALDLGPTLIEWGGGQRWLRGNHGAAQLRARVADAGGHATLFRRSDDSIIPFQPLAPAVLNLHRQLKSRFDPHGVFKPGRLIPEL